MGVYDHSSPFTRVQEGYYSFHFIVRQPQEDSLWENRMPFKKEQHVGNGGRSFTEMGDLFTIYPRRTFVG